MEEKKPRKMKARLFVRLGTFLVSHSQFVSVVCCTAGFVVLFLLPLLAKNTYVSENALMPGSANPKFSSQDILEANRLVKDIMGQRSMEGKEIEIPRLMAKHMEELGAEVYIHKFYPQRNQFHPLHFFSGTTDLGFMHHNSSCTQIGFSSVGIIRAPRGDGKEAVVLVTPYNSNKVEPSEALSLGLAFSVFSHLSRVAWLAKDFVWLAADSQYGEYTSVAAWLRDYHNPDFSSDAGEVGNGICLENYSLHQNSFKENPSDVFRRAGTMAAALVLKVRDTKERNEMDSLHIYAEASNGQMPNLDLINIAHYLAVHRQSLRVKIGMIGSLLTSPWVKILGSIQESLSKLAEKLNPNWKFGISTSDYIENAATLASSVYYQALGVPTGSHGAFRDYQVDAVTLEISSRISLKNDIVQSGILLRGGRLIEGVIRSVNNLLEKFHQSFFLYFLTSPNKFVSVGVYMIAFVLLIAPLPIVAAALFSRTYETTGYSSMSNQETGTGSTVETRAGMRSLHWLPAVRVVFSVHLWAAIVSLLPYSISQFSNQTAATSILAWVALSTLTLIIMYLVSGSPYSYSHQIEWALLKSVMIAAVSIGLGLMSIVNFATAQLGAMLVVPMCLMIRPLRRQTTVLLTACNLLLGLVGFPPAAFLILKGVMEGFGKVSIGDFWEWAESLWAWNSATYVYLGLVHLPCWVLCMIVLFHP